HLLGAGSLKPAELPEGVRVLAARGTLTAEAPVYGDSGLLVGAIVKRRPARNGVIVIPHWLTQTVDTHLPVVRPSKLPADLIKRINRASLVLSESLHDCVVADALGVPNRRLRLNPTDEWYEH